MTAEESRLFKNNEQDVPLEKWGPYLSERQWGTVREDYSENGDAWNYFPHDHARSRAYRWGEDGLAGISDFQQNLCFSFSFWNGKDPIIKERFFGLTNQEGNHGEDVKELYYYLDNLPSHYYMKCLYKYPQQAFPYNELITENKKRSRQDPEFEILDTGIFKQNQYFDLLIEYAKVDSDDICIRLTAKNRYHEKAELTVLPVLWFYNRWQYGGLKERPFLEALPNQSVHAWHERLGDYYFYYPKSSSLWFTENETNQEKLFQKPNSYPFVKDAFHQALIHNEHRDELANHRSGTKCAPVYTLSIEANDSVTLSFRLCTKKMTDPFPSDFENIFQKRKEEADEFYAAKFPLNDQKLSLIQRQAFAGLLWSRQYYHYDIERWLNTSDNITPVSDMRRNGRNSSWKYLKNQDILIMPDKWEYPWYASWDTAFHCITMALIDPSFAKNQLIILCREWYMNPEGQIPGYEWNFNDVNPPVQAFAALQVYEIEKKSTGKGDLTFLKRIFQKLIINFTWWTNRKDENGNNIFEGGFLGLDNIGVFNRNIKMPDGSVLEQTDGTSWMGMYALNLMDIALEIATHDTSFEDTCTKFYEHFVLIAEALNELDLWNEQDGFFYDVLSLNGFESVSLKVRSVVGLAPLFAVSVLEKSRLEKLKDFFKRMHWFNNYRFTNQKYLPAQEAASANFVLLSLVNRERLVTLIGRLLDENEFLSPHGIRALSKFHAAHPYTITLNNESYLIQYDPADSTSGLFGGNSNWRGPVWMPINFLIISALEKYGIYYGDSLKVECPKGSGKFCNLKDVAAFLRESVIRIFLPDENGNRPVYGNYNDFYKNGEEDLLLFHEYFHGDNGRGLGASHQTGWTALIVNLLQSNR